MDQSYFFDSLSQINKDIKKEYKSLRNRLQSILLDNEFLNDEIIATFPNYPIIPNERCGLWYVSPSQYNQTSYFKSTDGHTNQWDFSTRRLNFHLLETIAKSKGITIIDSTRRGKKIPDALSKTIPIWCAVLNYIMLRELKGGNDIVKVEDCLFVPPATVPKSEYDCILQKIPTLVEKLDKLEIINANELISTFHGKLLRPLWIYPGSSILHSSRDVFTGEKTKALAWEAPENIIPIVLCTISYQAQDGVDKRYGFTYVQGAADDHELWSCGLTPELFWSHINYLGNPTHSDDELMEYVRHMIEMKIKDSAAKTVELTMDAIFPNGVDPITPEISLGKIDNNIKITKSMLHEFKKGFSLVVILSETVTLNSDDKDEQQSDSVKIYKLTSGSKKSSKRLRTEIPKIYEVMRENLTNGKPILICCNTGTDISIGIILTILCKNYKLDPDNKKAWLRLEKETQDSNVPVKRLDKTIIRKNLTTLISHLEGRNVNPSRATLNSVNDYLM
ncbi:tRNA A64-2'-O-ribosylphosphate transferase NDAI_0K00350 [Naumovozyma dairenensis CBS 421]|uniref:Initiator tRNA phosphoribosyl transferase n=1 Tax=Naumovozyma dairenensis (strain ATCC 10597 / BCRC 20456 / CBS 421 / NBRC 0211 / NRRL Y-12639) TaxID=1071378 RepID=G0WHG3_NAUDC|nr:hypothetical protein NDAI_0K00350 [Naumovozyma dairenensis CBS 421]CCD27224.1 hypothetical protein NDAI_0K00350 [Naumovozyma dairenensis CBS 421]